MYCSPGVIFLLLDIWHFSPHTVQTQHCGRFQSPLNFICVQSTRVFDIHLSSSWLSLWENTTMTDWVSGDKRHHSMKGLRQELSGITINIIRRTINEDTAVSPFNFCSFILPATCCYNTYHLTVTSICHAFDIFIWSNLCIMSILFLVCLSYLSPIHESHQNITSKLEFLSLHLSQVTEIKESL